jgi:hypothetical protein
MSQLINYTDGLEALTGDFGGLVEPDQYGNIFILGEPGVVFVDGIPLTNTLEINLDGSVANQYVTDAGTATPVNHILNIIGGHGINTTGVGDDVTVLINNTITLGDLALAVGDSLTLTTGNETITAGDLNMTAGNINMPASNALGTEGYITVSGTPFVSSLGVGNTFVGSGAGGLQITTADSCAGFGLQALADLTTGDSNTAVGAGSLSFITTGQSNIAVGTLAGANLTLADSSDILIGNAGVLGESNTIRIGKTGAGVGEQNNCYVAGITGVNVGSVATVVSHSADHLGSTTITAGPGIQVTPGANTITIESTINYTPVNTTPYVVLVTDLFISVDTTTLAITIQLPNAATVGDYYIIKDRSGLAATNNITVTTVGGAVLIDGAATYTMNTAFQSIQLIGNSTGYEVF